MSNLAQFKSPGMINKGAYAAGTTYYVNQIVTYGGLTYVCISNGTVGNLPTNATYWTVLAASPDIAVSTTGTGTNPATFTLSASGNTVTLNRVS